MRYYDIKITDPGAGGKEIVRYTSHPKGKMAPPDPGALQIEMVLEIATEKTGTTNSFVKIWGVSLEQISQAQNLNPVDNSSGGTQKSKNIVIYGGMGKGLPLAKPQLAGKLLEGQIIQAFGNWTGVNMTLDLIVAPGVVPAASPAQPNIIFNYKAGQDLATAIKNTLDTAFPQLSSLIKIGKNLVLNYDQPGFFGTLSQFAEYINGLSKAIQTAPGYRGVEMSVNEKTITVFDGSAAALAKEIKFDDLVGQPTWIEPGLIQVQCVMRSDIKMGDFIKLPPTLVTTQSASLTGFARLKQGLVFSGTLNVTGKYIRHVGNYKSPQGEAWSTYLTCAPTPTPGSEPPESTNLSSQSTDNVPGTG